MMDGMNNLQGVDLEKAMFQRRIKKVVMNLYEHLKEETVEDVEIAVSVLGELLTAAKKKRFSKEKLTDISIELDKLDS